MTDNELIAQFYGAEFIRKEDQFRPGEFIEQWIIKGNPFNQYRDQETKYWYPKELLLYHESWEWIMPVVEKIESMGYKSTLFCHSSNDHSFHIKDGSHSMFGDSFENTKIKAVYKAVVEFIKWYNQNRKQ